MALFCLDYDDFVELQNRLNRAQQKKRQQRKELKQLNKALRLKNQDIERLQLRVAQLQERARPSLPWTERRVLPGTWVEEALQ